MIAYRRAIRHVIKQQLRGAFRVDREQNIIVDLVGLHTLEVVALYNVIGRRQKDKKFDKEKSLKPILDLILERV